MHVHEVSQARPPEHEGKQELPGLGCPSWSLGTSAHHAPAQMPPTLQNKADGALVQGGEIAHPVLEQAKTTDWTRF